MRVRGLIVSNPNNPLGVCYTADQLQTMLDFAYEVGACAVVPRPRLSLPA